MSRRDMVSGDITSMNPEELRELNKIAKANLLSKNRKGRVRHNPAAFSLARHAKAEDVHVLHIDA